jgi:uncharacterized protein YbgA (DUF1722 family)/uncharacterized protein YbbK (DUF523 family)
VSEPTAADSPREKPRIGVSACLLGQAVRWDGGHKRDRFLNDALAPWVEWVAVCPEIEIGLGAPRETIRLVGNALRPRLVGGASGADHTDAMRAYAEAKLAELERLDLCGYVLKSDSPTCGMERVRVYDRRGMARREGVGAFARVLLERMPELPVEEEGRLNDAGLREAFLERVFARKRWRDFLRGGLSPRRLVDFHRVHKYLLMAHSPRHYSALGRIVADAGRTERAELERRYGTMLTQALRERATVPRHVNVLQHLAGYFKDRLDSAGRQELAGVFADYARRLVPLVVPVTLVRHHARALDVAYLQDQVYLAPGPKELMLRNYV